MIAHVASAASAVRAEYACGIVSHNPDLPGYAHDFTTPDEVADTSPAAYHLRKSLHPAVQCPTWDRTHLHAHSNDIRSRQRLDCRPSRGAAHAVSHILR